MATSEERQTVKNYLRHWGNASPLHLSLAAVLESAEVLARLEDDCRLPRPCGVLTLTPFDIVERIDAIRQEVRDERS